MLFSNSNSRCRCSINKSYKAVCSSNSCLLKGSPVWSRLILRHRGSNSKPTIHSLVSSCTSKYSKTKLSRWPLNNNKPSRPTSSSSICSSNRLLRLRLHKSILLNPAWLMRGLGDRLRHKFKLNLPTAHRSNRKDRSSSPSWLPTNNYMYNSNSR